MQSVTRAAAVLNPKSRLHGKQIQTDQAYSANVVDIKPKPALIRLSKPQKPEPEKEDQLRQASRHTDHRPVFDAGALPWAVLSKACAAGDTAALESLWRDHKRPEQARAAAVKAVFAGACAAENLPLAGWVATLYPQHIDAKTLKDSAAAALRRSPHRVWPFLAEKIDARHGASDIYRSLFKDALEHAPVQAAEKIFPHMDGAASGYIYAAVLGGNMPVLVWLTGACRAQGALPRADLDKALLLATERAQTPMVSHLLQLGADAGAFDDAALKRAAPHATADGGALLDLLVRAGAHPQKAQDIARRLPAGEELAQRLAQAGADAAEYHLARLAQHCGAPPDAARLAQVQDALGMTGLHYAAEHRLLHRLPKDSFSASGLAQKNAAGETTIDVVVRRGAWASFFNPQDWGGQVEKLTTALGLLKQDIWDEAARAACLRRAERLTLEAAVPDEGFTLKRRPKR